MLTIGLTGGTGSGKSVVSQSLARRGAYIIDCDAIAHQILEKGQDAYEEIKAYFGEGILDVNGNIIRRSLGGIVFTDQEKLAFLNACTHKYIVERTIEEIKYAKDRPQQYSIAVVDAPLLIEANLTGICDAIWVVYAEERVRIERIMARDGITCEDAENRIRNQKKWEEYQAYADEVIDNSKELEFVEEQLDSLMRKIRCEKRRTE